MRTADGGANALPRDFLGGPRERMPQDVPGWPGLLLSGSGGFRRKRSRPPGNTGSTFKLQWKRRNAWMTTTIAPTAATEGRNGGKTLYRAAFCMHPSARWARSSPGRRRCCCGWVKEHFRRSDDHTTEAKCANKLYGFFRDDIFSARSNL